jgi:hypothetical protein
MKKVSNPAFDRASPWRWALSFYGEPQRPVQADGINPEGAVGRAERERTGGGIFSSHRDPTTKKDVSAFGTTRL